jgi:hypothetical protein
MHLLHIDGGGVRGLSQLIILKALMDKVAELEKSQPDENGRQVESSFHPLSYDQDKSVKLRKGKSKNGHNQIKASNPRKNQKEKLSDDSSEDERLAAFFPYHYFDWIAGTSTGGYAFRLRPSFLVTRLTYSFRLNAIMLGRLRMSVDECLADYSELARKVFGKPRWASYRFSPFFWFCSKYSGDRLRDVVKEVVDRHLCEGEGYMFAMNKEMCRT